MRQARVGDQVLFLELQEDNITHIFYPAIVTVVKSDNKVSLFIMKEKEAISVQDIPHGAAHSHWFYRGEFGIQ